MTPNLFDVPPRDPQGELFTPLADASGFRVERIVSWGDVTSDGSWYDQPCYDPAHGHAVPSTRQEHVDAILQIAQGVHADLMENNPIYAEIYNSQLLHASEVSETSEISREVAL